ncbi:hypothetical protein [Pseudomonas coronafaciens]|uniref:hypothetical protein n=1 Tax=Pseudomonas coronafaciens TaxID=53409 RepID=UPI0006D64708|nr:hypothetical protein [Pseudomonas coronafaciens]
MLVVSIDLDSVHAGDDLESHKMSVTLDPSATNYLASAGQAAAPRNVSVETTLYAADELRGSDNNADKDHTGRPTDY